MPSKILTDLAPELLIQILKSSHCFADVTSLASTSRKMFIVWKMNHEVICEAILALTVPCYTQALELINAQEIAEGDEHSVFGYQSAIDRAQWILKEADTAFDALVYFKDHVFCTIVDRAPPHEQATLTRAEEYNFVQAYYRANTLVTLGEKSLPTRLLSTWNMLDLGQVKDVMVWFCHCCSVTQQRDLGMWSDRNCLEQVPIGITRAQDWATAFTSIVGLIEDLNQVTLKAESDRPLVAFPYLLRDYYHHAYESSGSAKLGDLLTLVRQKGILYNEVYRLSEE